MTTNPKLTLLPGDILATSQWAGPDNEKTYKQNLIDQLPSWHWRNTPVTYTLNSQGYRAPEWEDIDWANSILAFGCSYTFGVGISDEQTWPAQLSKQLGVPVINIGMGGTSNMFHWANTVKLLMAGVKPRACVYWCTHPNRVAEFYKDGVYNWGPWDSNGFGMEWVLHDTHGNQYAEYVRNSCQQMWDCPTLFFSHLTDYKTVPEYNSLLTLTHEYLDFARDVTKDSKGHPGPETNASWAEIIANQLKPLL